MNGRLRWKRKFLTDGDPGCLVLGAGLLGRREADAE